MNQSEGDLATVIARLCNFITWTVWNWWTERTSVIVIGTLGTLHTLMIAKRHLEFHFRTESQKRGYVMSFTDVNV